MKNISYIHARHTVVCFADGYNIKGEKIPTQKIINTKVLASVDTIVKEKAELSPKGGITFAIIHTPTQVMIRSARCHPKDNYCKRTGRQTALRKTNRMICTRTHWEQLCKEHKDNFSRIRQLAHEVELEAARLKNPEQRSFAAPAPVV